MKERRPLGNVLVATAFSAVGTAAVERAAQLPVGPDSTVTVLHVLRPGCGPEDRADADRALSHAVSVVGDSAARAGREAVTILPRLVDGTPFVEIIRRARDARCELIVIGRHGERTFRGLLLGSTAERVIRKGDTPVLVVASHPAAPYGRPLVAVDCSDTSRRALELGWRLVDPRVEALDVVHAYEVISESTLRRSGVIGEAARRYHVERKQQAQVAVEKFLAHGDVAAAANIVVREGDARQVILDVAAQHDADLVAVGTHGPSALAHVLLGSVAEAVARAASCDVLVARAVGTPFELP